jgi:hypothetical protein
MIKKILILIAFIILITTIWFTTSIFKPSDEDNIKEMLEASKNDIALSDFLNQKFNPPYESFELSLYYLNKCQTKYLTPYHIELMRYPMIQEAVALAAPSIRGEIERGGMLSVNILQANLFHLTGSARKLLNPSKDEELSADELGNMLFTKDKSKNNSKKLKEELKKSEHFRQLFYLCSDLDVMTGLLGAPTSVTKEVFDEVSNQIGLGARRTRNKRINNLLNN